MRVLVTFVISTFGSFGAQAKALIKDTSADAPISLCLLRSLKRHLGLPYPSPPSLDLLLPFKSANVLQSFSVNISQMTFSSLLCPVQTPSTAYDQGNLVGNFLA